MMTVTLSCDHRAARWRPSAAFLNQFTEEINALAHFPV